MKRCCISANLFFCWAHIANRHCWSWTWASLYLLQHSAWFLSKSTSVRLIGFGFGFEFIRWFFFHSFRLLVRLLFLSTETWCSLPSNEIMHFVLQFRAMVLLDGMRATVHRSEVKLISAHSTCHKKHHCIHFLPTSIQLANIYFWLECMHYTCQNVRSLPTEWIFIN